MKILCMEGAKLLARNILVATAPNVQEVSLLDLC